MFSGYIERMILLMSLFACGPSASSTSCSNDADVLIDGDAPLTCADAKIPSRFVRILKGRPLPPGSAATSIQAVHARWTADPVSARSWLDGLKAAGQAIEAAHGLEGAEIRSQTIWSILKDEGPITKTDGPVWNLQDDVLSVYARDDEEKLVLTETDIEGWILFASLLHEVQGNGVLRVSVANRADVYTMVKQRFEQGDREEKLALVSLGAVWPEVVDRWKAAPYAKQQRFIQAAVVPENQPSTALGFVETVIEGDLVTNAHALHRALGPLHPRDGDGYFTEP